MSVEGLISVIQNVVFWNYPDPFIIHKMLVIPFKTSKTEALFFKSLFLTVKQEKLYFARHI
jgi:hypothetical protein